ncbi:MAG: TIR domain-containing protein, partial [Acidobacteria bacterium]|nr:TIR domain-containing protein [Acidobacteriota bacterium]
MKKTVFISYSTKDKETAAKVRKVLVEHGIDVTIDSESLDPGKDIRAFIDKAIRETQVTLSIVSENSLTSDWVALETLDSFEAEKYLEGKKFIACYVDARFFERAFVIEAVDQIDMEIKELEKLIRSAARKKLDATNLQTQKSRKYNLRNNLPKILDRLNRSLTLDIRGEGFDTSLQRIIDEMTVTEKANLLRLTFEQLWRLLWGEYTRGSQYKNEEHISFEKYRQVLGGIRTKDGRIKTLHQFIDESATRWTETEWGFPKGRRNYNEKDLPCALRE